MPKKPTRGRKLDLAFGSEQTDQSWALDDFDPDLPPPPVENAEGGEEAGAKRGGRGIASVRAAEFGNFRGEEQKQLNTVVPADMKAPFTAHVRRLPKTIKDETIKEMFTECGPIVEVRTVRHENAFYAYVEFETRDALQNAILMSGKIVGRGPMMVDIAQQPKNPRGGGMNRSGSGMALDRDGMGEQQNSSGSGMGRSGSRQNLADFDRDAMGTQQQQQPRFGGGFGSFSRDDMGGENVRTPNTGGAGGGFPNFSRDDMGSAQPMTPNRRSGPRGGSKAGSPNAREGGSFGDFRSSTPKDQPPASGSRSNRTSESDTDSERGGMGGKRQPKFGGGGGGGWRSDAKAAPPRPAVADAGGSWRDAPQEKQPELRGGFGDRAQQQQDKPAREDASPASGGGGGGSWRSGGGADSKPAERKPAGKWGGAKPSAADGGGEKRHADPASSEEAKKPPAEGKAETKAAWRTGGPPAWRTGESNAAVMSGDGPRKTEEAPSATDKKAPMKVVAIEKRGK